MPNELCFNTHQLLSDRIKELVASDTLTKLHVRALIDRHQRGDWGHVGHTLREMNNHCLDAKTANVFSFFNTPHGTIVVDTDLSHPIRDGHYVTIAYFEKENFVELLRRRDSLTHDLSKAAIVHEPSHDPTLGPERDLERDR